LKVNEKVGIDGKAKNAHARFDANEYCQNGRIVSHCVTEARDQDKNTRLAVDFDVTHQELTVEVTT